MFERYLYVRKQMNRFRGSHRLLSIYLRISFTRFTKMTNMQETKTLSSPHYDWANTEGKRETKRETEKRQMEINEIASPFFVSDSRESRPITGRPFIDLHLAAAKSGHNEHGKRYSILKWIARRPETEMRCDAVTSSRWRKIANDKSTRERTNPVVMCDILRPRGRRSKCAIQAGDNVVNELIEGKDVQIM